MDSLDKKFYSTSEVSALTGVPESTLRYWETEFSELRPSRSPKGRRRYTPANIETVRMLQYLLKDRGLKIEAARTELRRNRRGVDLRHDCVKRLREVRATLVKLITATRDNASQKPSQE